MKCAESERAILLGETDELPERRKAELMEHLSDCRHCREYREDVRQITETAGGPGLVSEPRPAVIASIRSAAERRATGHTLMLPMPMTRALAYAAVLAVLIGVWQVLPTNGRTERISEVSTILAMVSEYQLPELDVTDAAGRDEALRALANQLLQMEGLAADDFTESTTEEPGPTALRWRSTVATPTRIRV